MSRILIVYSTTDGHTLEICQKIQSLLEQAGDRVQLLAIDRAGEPDLESVDKIVIGARIRYGKHQPAVYEFIERNLQRLQQIPGAFFSVNVVARKPDKNQPHNNPYMQTFLKKIRWQPDELGVFAGKIDYQKYGFFDRQMIRFIMFLTKGPTEPDAVADFTDWQQGESFADTLHNMTKNN